ncbi:MULTISPECIES: M14 family metallopeptidase [Hyphobacterium]|uniref:M14 family metallopeptidase n=1 Tax=Hyphobacterium vulgare TaxID=1736751 RepID=A0ABV7A1E6_9PROT
MKRFVLVVPVVLFVLSACATVQNTDCTQGEVRLTQDFSNAPDYACRRTGLAAFELTVVPESTPINPSPWFAFDIETAREAEVSIALDYGEYRHRYRPKVEESDGNWIAFPDSAVSLDDDGHAATLRVTLSPGRYRVAAQEVIGIGERAAWREDFAARNELEIETIGHSLDGRAIEALTRAATTPDAPLIIIVGGQHPPEVTGVLGLRTFLTTLFADAAANAALDRFEWLIVPDLNPDGVAEGHWRENLGGTDLNRDWGPFEQPETAAIRDAITARHGAGHTPFILLDFHSTRHDVIYTPHDNAGLTPANFSAGWIALLNGAWTGEGEAFARDPSHNPGLPTAKSWFALTYNAPGLTVEFGDETDRERVAELSRAAAIALRQYLEAAETQPGLDG